METEELVAAPPEYDQDEQAFLDAAAAHDRGEDIKLEVPDTQKDSDPREAEKLDEVPVPEGEQKQTDNSDSAPVKERRRDAQGRFLKDDGSVDPDQVEVPQENTDSVSEFEQKKREKAAKEKERQDRSWEALNREKEEVRAKAQELAQVQQQLAQRAQASQSNGQRKYNSRDMAEAASEFRQRAITAFKDGDIDEGDKHLDLANKAWGQAQQLGRVEMQERQEYARNQFQGQWNNYLEESIKAEPEIHKPESPVHKEIVSLLEDPEYGRVLEAIPNGFKHAVELAKLRVNAGEASELKVKNKELQAENNRLNGLTTTSSSGPTKPSGSKTFDAMSDDEQTDYLLRQAKEIDRGNN